MRHYFIHDGQNQQGPFDLEELKAQCITKHTYIWHEGLASWTTADKVGELYLLFIVTPPPLDTESTSTATPPPFFAPVSKSKEQIKKDMRHMRFTIITIIIVVVVGLGAFAIYQNQKVIIAQEHLKRQRMAEIQKTTSESVLKNISYRMNWKDFILIENIDYKVDAFGGIKEFKLEVKNNSEYVLDEVDVMITYYKTTGEVYKSDIHTFYNIYPYAKKSKKIPKSSRGKTVKGKIIAVFCKKMNFCFPVDNGNPADPFYCK